MSQAKTSLVWNLAPLVYFPLKKRILNNPTIEKMVENKFCRWYKGTMVLETDNHRQVLYFVSVTKGQSFVGLTRESHVQVGLTLGNHKQALQRENHRQALQRRIISRPYKGRMRLGFLQRIPNNKLQINNQRVA